jgi:hypothetical protein
MNNLSEQFVNINVGAELMELPTPVHHRDDWYLQSSLRSI